MSRSIVLLLIILPIVVTSFFAVYKRNEMIRVGYETGALQKQKSALLRYQKELLVEVERLSALDRIEQIALEQIGMQHPEPEQRVFITAQVLNKRLNEN